MSAACQPEQQQQQQQQQQQNFTSTISASVKNYKIWKENSGWTPETAEMTI